MLLFGVTDELDFVFLRESFSLLCPIQSILWSPTCYTSVCQKAPIGPELVVEAASPGAAPAGAAAAAPGVGSLVHGAAAAAVTDILKKVPLFRS